MEFKGLTLDDFQEQAIRAIDDGHSCVVSASTGTGKTLIAEYIIHTHLPQGNTIIYTAPIKALSNQKYKDFCKDYGKDSVGLLTGDTSINPEGQILVMTTEIYRNMLLSNDPLVDKISYVIFDEVHYINDIQRGVIWEESIIFSPSHIRFLALSATIPNYKEFADWIASIKHHEVKTVFYGHRPVPLDHKVFDKLLGMTTINEIRSDKLRDEQYDHVMAIAKKKKGGKKKSSYKRLPPPYHLEVIPEIENKLPGLFFCFSRKKCEDFAVELSAKKNFVSTEESLEINNIIRNHMTDELAGMASTKKLRQTLKKGIGFHHSGMLPQLKNIVEEIFGKGLLKLLYTTETFSVGINMPAKTVVFNSVEKYDGISMRMLNAKEYFQIAGRAGRRGIDTEGNVVVLIDRHYTDLDKLEKISTVDDEPIISQFKLSTNTVLNLIDNFDDATQEVLLKSNFDYYVRTKQKKKAVHIMASYRNKIKRLLKLNYIVEAKDVQQQGGYVELENDYYLTDKGRFAKYLYSNEVVLTELFHLKFLDTFSDLDLLTLLAAIVYEERRLDYFMIKGSEGIYKRIMTKLHGTTVFEDINKMHLKRMVNFVRAWATGAKFSELMKFSNLQEGDIIRFFRRLIDTITQLQHATNDEQLKDKLQELIKRIDRDLVADI
jgi:superfamily II RNA helicase